MQGLCIDVAFVTTALFNQESASLRLKMPFSEVFWPRLEQPKRTQKLHVMTH